MRQLTTKMETTMSKTSKKTATSTRLFQDGAKIRVINAENTCREKGGDRLALVYAAKQGMAKVA